MNADYDNHIQEAIEMAGIALDIQDTRLAIQVHTTLRF